tara:strand:+ start:805 stop:1083 length:279 start_codon:yes stop_codon:yes gene_type:complete
MFKVINVLFLLFLMSFSAGSLQAEEKPVKKDNVQLLYLIRLEDPNDKAKNYDVIINGVGWFGKRRPSGVHVVVDLKNKQNFIKPSFIKKVKK